MNPIRPLLVTLLASVLMGSGGAARASQEPDTAAGDWSQVSEYRIVPGDDLALDFGPRDGTEFVKHLKVRPDGRISVYPVGDVVAAGRTPRELEQSLVDLLGAELRNPRVAVEVEKLAGNMVHVVGRVVQSGSYEVTPFMTVLEAITRAGGFSDDAARNSVLLFHRDGAHTLRVTRVRIDHALKSGRLDGDPMLSRFDIVYVPRSTIGNVNVFAKQFFAEQQPVLSTIFTGWELFHLDRIFVVGR